jgi:hypothetical protein
MLQATHHSLCAARRPFLWSNAGENRQQLFSTAYVASQGSEGLMPGLKDESTQSSI